MKKYFGFMVLILCIHGQNSLAQYFTFTKQSNGTNLIAIPPGEIWQLVTLSTYSGSSGDSAAEIFSSTNLTGENVCGQISNTRGMTVGMDGAANQAMPASSAGALLVGPVYIRMYTPFYYYSLVFKKISNQADASLSATSVVIPSSASGDVDVKMEQSADNVTWTECLPGTYNSSTVKRFFRLRAVEK